MDLLLQALSGPQISLEDPSTMNLTEEEIERANTIKAAVDLDEGLTDLSDFEYVQYALTRESSLPIVLEHMTRMQQFREAYGISDKVEQGIACLEQMTPGLCLSIHYLPSMGNCIAVYDWTAFQPHQVPSFAAFLKGLYYWFQCLNPTFLAMRLGISSLVECEGISWENYHVQFQKQLWEQLFGCYPQRHKDLFLVNAPLVINVDHGLWNQYMTPNMKDAFYMGSNVPGLVGRTMVDLFSSPTPEAGRQHMTDNARRLLRKRYQHQTAFCLPPIVDTALQDPQAEAPSPPPSVISLSEYSEPSSST